MSSNSRRGPAWQALATKIKERDNYTCAYQFGNCTYDTDLTIDHIEPLDTFAGRYPDVDPDSEWNLVTACRSCNSAKKNKKIVRRNWVDTELFPAGLLR